MDAARRRLLGLAAPAAAAALVPARSADAAPPDLPPAIAALSDQTAGVAPIEVDEHRARVVACPAAAGGERARRAGARARAPASRTSRAPRGGCPSASSARCSRARATRVGGARVRERARRRADPHRHATCGPGRSTSRPTRSSRRCCATAARRPAASAVDEAMPFAFSDGIAQGAARGARRERHAGDRRLPHDQGRRTRSRSCAAPNEITVRAYRAVFASLAEGMHPAARSRAGAARRTAGWACGGGALVLFGADAAFPHGTTKPQPLRAGRRGADRRRRPPARLRERHHAHGRLRRAAHRAPAQDLGPRAAARRTPPSQAARPGVECQASTPRRAR